LQRLSLIMLIRRSQCWISSQNSLKRRLHIIALANVLRE
jgi:hypothetical protein